MANEFIARKGLIALADSTISGSLNVTGTITGDGSGLTGVTAVQAPGGTDGQIQYNNAGVTGGASTLYWDEANGRLGIGTSTPSSILHLQSSSDYDIRFTRVGAEEFRLRHGTSGVYWTGPNTSTLLAGVDQNHDFVVFNNAGSQYAIFDGSTSRVGIGTANPATKLHIVGSTYVNNGTLYVDSGNYLMWGNSTQGIRGVNDTSLDFIVGSSERMRITNTGNVGIGTTAPYTKLDLRPDALTGLTLPTFGTSAHSGIHIVPSGTATAEAWYGITFGNTAGGASERERTTAGIFTSASGTYGNNLYFATSDSWATGAVSRMMIDNVGRVGIGTQSPSYPLTVRSSTGTVGVAYFDSADNHERIYIGTTNDYIERKGSEQRITFAAQGTAGFFTFQTSGTEKLRITNDGKVGIGTTTPTHKLDVSGDANFSGLLEADSGILSRNKIQISQGRLWELIGNTSGFTIKDGSANQDRVTIDTAGNVGIGTTAPDAKLTVTASSGDLATFYTGSTKYLTIKSNGNLSFNTSGNYGLEWGTASLKFNGQTEGVQVIPFSANYVGFTIKAKAGQTYDLQQWKASNGTALSVVDANGNFGIGTTTPGSPLEVYGSGSTVLDIQGSQGQLFSVSDSLTGSLMSVNDISGLPILEVFDNDKVVMGEYGSNTLVVSGSKVGIGTDVPVYALDIDTTEHAGLRIQRSGVQRIISDASGNNGGFVFTGALGNKFAIGAKDNDFHIYDGSYMGNGDLRLAITQAGNVGIGTTSPSQKLDVAGNVNVTGAIYGGNEIRVGSAQWLRFGTKPTLWADPTTVILRGGSGNDAFRYEDSSGNEKLRITSDGKVGIGTSAPVGILHVSSTTGWGGIFERGIKDGSTSAFSHYYSAGNAHILGRALILESSLTLSSTSADATTKEYRFNHSSDKLKLQSVVAGVTTDDNIIVFDGGNVGIGTASPSEKLDVVGNAEISGNLVVGGNFTVNGTTTTINSTTLTVANKKIIVAQGATNAAQADLSGIEVDGVNASMLYTSASDSFEFNKSVITSGDLTVAGKVTAQEFHTEFVSASIIYQSGSTKFGDTADDIHDFTGSLNVEGNIKLGAVSPKLYFNDAQTFYTGWNNSTRLLFGINGYDTVQFVQVGSSGGGRIEVTPYTSNYNYPAYTFSGDDNTGLTSTSQDTVTLVTSGSARLHVDSSGNVGIGTTSPTSKLYVQGSGYTNGVLASFRAYQNHNSPFAEFVGGTDTATWLDISGGPSVSTWASGLRIQQANSANTIQGFMMLGSGARGGAPSLGSSAFHLISHKAGTASYVPMMMWTGGFPRMTLDINGNIGIGTTTPTQKLDVVGNITLSEYLYHRDDANQYLQLTAANARLQGPRLDFSLGADSAPQGGDIQFASANGQDFTVSYTRTGNAVFRQTFAGQAMHWQNNALNTVYYANRDGNVGIGTTNPTVNLHVTGPAQDAAPTTVRIGAGLGYGNAIPRIELAENMSGNDMSYGFSITADGASSNNLLIRNHSNNVAGNVALAVDRISGNVGIGATSPDHPLHIYSAATGNATNLKIQSTSQYGGIGFFENTANRGTLAFGNDGNIFTGALTDSLSLRAEQALHLGAGGNNLSMTIGTNGNVGIGTSSPSYKLHVDGTIGAKPLNYKFIVGTNQQDSYGYNLHTPSMPLNGYLWHDLFAFDYNYTRTQEVSVDGVNWDPVSLQRDLFIQKQDHSIAVIDSGEQAVRWTFQGVAWSVADFLNIAFTWASPSNAKTILVETSADNVTWTTRHSSTASGGISTKSCYLSSYGGDNYMRITIAKATPNTDVVNLSSIRLMTARAGDQGRGMEDHYPYTWDADKTITTGAVRTTSNNNNYFTGNTGFGTTSPSSRAHVKGELRIERSGLTASSVINMEGNFQFIASTGYAHTFHSNGAEMVRFYDGKVGIGTTSPAYPLDVNGSMRADSYRIGGATVLSGSSTVQLGSGGATGVITLNTTSGEGLRLTGSNVGIGTTTPSYKLDVVGTTRFTGNLTSIGDTFKEGDLLFRNDTAGDNVKIRDIDWRSTAAEGTDDRLGVIRVYTSAGSSTTRGGQMNFYTRQANSANFNTMIFDRSGNLYVPSNIFANSEQVATQNWVTSQGYITSGQAGLDQATADLRYVNIDGDTMTGRLLMSNATNGTGLHITADTASGGGGVLRLNKSAADKQVYQTFESDTLFLGVAANQTTVADIGTKGGVSLDLKTGYSTRMRITSDGKVGIGTTSPQQKLDVNGNAYINGILYVAGTDPYIWSVGTNALRIKHTDGQTMYIRPDEGGTISFFEGSAGQSIYLMTATPSVNGTANDSTALRLQARAKNAAGTVNTRTSLIKTLIPDIEANRGLMEISGVDDVRVNANLSVGQYATDLLSVYRDSTSGQFATYRNNTGFFLHRTYADYNNAGDLSEFQTRVGVDGTYGSIGMFSNHSFQIRTNNTSRIAIQNTGEVGIGTTSPAQKLHVNGNMQLDGGVIYSTSSSLTLQNTGGSWLTLNSRGINLGDFTTNPSYGDILIGSYDFDIIKSGSTSVLRISNGTGNVGIGTTAPETKLHIQETNAGDAGGMLYLKNSTESAGTYTGVYFGTWGKKSGIFHQQGSYGGYGKGDILFATNTLSDGTIVSPADAKMVITNPGNVGIGTTAPATLLHVHATGNGNRALIVEDDARKIEIGRDQIQVKDLTDAVTNIYINPNGGNTILNANAGNAGIGTLSASSKLTVNGDIRVANSGRLYLWNDHNINYIDYSKWQTSASAGMTIENQASTGHVKLVSNGNVGVYVNNDGKVGFNTTSPTTDFHVVGAASTGWAIFQRGTKQLYVNANYSGQDVFAQIAPKNGHNMDLSLAGTDLRQNDIYIKYDTGNVGIGTSSPLEKLHVEGAIKLGQHSAVVGNGIAHHTNGYLYVTGGTSGAAIGNDSYSSAVYAVDNGSLELYAGSSNRLHITSGGNVGIGTTNPLQNLHVVGKGLFDGNRDILLDSNLGNVRISAPSSGGWAIGTFFDDALGSDVGGFGAYGTSTALGYYFIGSAYNTPTMAITSDGKVGIGTTGPTEELHIYRSNSNVDRQLLLDQDGAGDATLAFRLTGITEYAIGIDNSDGDKFKIAQSSGVGTNDRLTIDSSGRVGVGMSIPTRKLDVSGAVRAGGKTIYTKIYGSLDAVGQAVAGLVAAGNGGSALFTFICYGAGGDYQKIVYSCRNVGGIWETFRVIDEGTNIFTVEASPNDATITFTFKTTGGTQAYSPTVNIEHVGYELDTTHL